MKKYTLSYDGVLGGRFQTKGHNLNWMMNRLSKSASGKYTKWPAFRLEYGGSNELVCVVQFL